MRVRPIRHFLSGSDSGISLKHRQANRQYYSNRFEGLPAFFDIDFKKLKSLSEELFGFLSKEDENYLYSALDIYKRNKKVQEWLPGFDKIIESVIENDSTDNLEKIKDIYDLLYSFIFEVSDTLKSLESLETEKISTQRALRAVRKELRAVEEDLIKEDDPEMRKKHLEDLKAVEEEKGQYNEYLSEINEYIAQDIALLNELIRKPIL